MHEAFATKRLFLFRCAHRLSCCGGPVARDHVDTGRGMGADLRRASGWEMAVNLVLSLVFPAPAVSCGLLRRFACPSQGGGARCYNIAGSSRANGAEPPNDGA